MLCAGVMGGLWCLPTRSQFTLVEVPSLCSAERFTMTSLRASLPRLAFRHLALQTTKLQTN